MHQHRRGAGFLRWVDLVFGGGLSKLAAQDGQGAEFAGIPLNIPARLHGKVVIDKPFLIVFAIVVAISGVACPCHLPALGRLQVIPVDPLPVRIALAGLNPEQIGVAVHHDILEVARRTVDSVKQLFCLGGLHPAGAYRRYGVGGGQRWRFRAVVIPPRRARRLAGSRHRYRIGRTQREVALPQGGAPF